MAINRRNFPIFKLMSECFAVCENRNSVIDIHEAGIEPQICSDTIRIECEYIHRKQCFRALNLNYLPTFACDLNNWLQTNVPFQQTEKHNFNSPNTNTNTNANTANGNQIKYLFYSHVP